MKRDRTQPALWSASGLLAALALVSIPNLYAPLSAPLYAQTHKVAAPENVVRAVGVYEWTGDMAKPAASRLIPVTLFIDGKLQDAGVYLSRPVPMALLSGNEYQLQKAGVFVDDLDLAFAKHLMAADGAATNYDDGWFGYGKVMAPPPPKKSTLKPSQTLSKINAIDDENDDKPHFSSRSATPGSGDAANVPGATPASSTPTDDPNRPTLHRTGTSTDSSAGTPSTGSGSTPTDDPDRPTLRRRSAADTKADAKNPTGERDSVTTVADSLNDDPNRPTLHRGKPVNAMNEQDLPRLTGLPGDQDLHQLVGVSDATNRPTHDFARAWEDEEEHQAILGKMQAAARAKLTEYEAANGAAAAPAASTSAPDTRRPASKLRRPAAKETTPPPPEPLLDEDLKGYTLSYGGAATFIYYAHTGGLGSALRYVTVVAQENMQSEPEIAITNVTDAAHLDRTPRMRLVDAVDAEASNRASLLFELRAQSSRQFALYRVLGGRATQTFLTGSTQ